MFIFDLYVWFSPLKIKDPVVFSNGQYLQVDSWLHGLRSIGFGQFFLLFLVLFVLNGQISSE